MNREEKMNCFIKKMVEAWSVFLDEDENRIEEGKETDVCNTDIEIVRQILLEKAQEGKSARIREILQAFQVDKLSDLNEKHYDELLQMVERI